MASVSYIGQNPFLEGWRALLPLGLRLHPLAGKRPVLPDWVNQASSDPAVLEVWAQQYAQYNIGIVLGYVPEHDRTYLVLDLDVTDEGGNGGQSLDEYRLARSIPVPPPTLMQRTGGGGVQLFYYVEGERQVDNHVGLLPGVDVRAVGGQVAAPPSVHPDTGAIYEWVDPAVPIAPAPDWVRELVQVRGPGERKKRKGGKLSPELDGPPIPDHERNTTLTSIAGMLKNKGYSRNAILGALYDINEARCQPPLAGEQLQELEWIADQSMKWDAEPPQPSWPRAEEPAGQPGYRNTTDLGNAFRLVDNYGGSIRHSSVLKSWFVWGVIRWREDDMNTVNWLAAQTTLAIHEEARTTVDLDRRGDLGKWAMRSEASSHLTAMVKHAQDDPRVVITPDVFDRDPWLFNTHEGTWDARTGELRPHDANDMITRVCPTHYVPGARDAVWERFIEEAIPDPDIRSFVQRFLGMCLTGDVTEKAVLIPHGPPNTGKSTLTSAFYKTLGDVAMGGYASAWDADVIQLNSNVNRNEKLHKVRAARAVLSSEQRKGSKMADSFVKQLSGGDPVDAKALYKGSFSYYPKFKLIIPTNYIPHSTDPALQSRLRPVPFNEVPAVIDVSIRRYLEENPRAHEAILQWLMQGCRAWVQSQSLGSTPWMREQLATYARESNPLIDFMSFFMPWPELEPSIHVDLAWRLYEAWSREYLQVGQQMRRRVFEMALGEMGYIKQRVPARGGTMRWAGVVLNSEAEVPDPCKHVLATWNMEHPVGDQPYGV